MRLNDPAFGSLPPQLSTQCIGHVGLSCGRTKPNETKQKNPEGIESRKIMDLANEGVERNHLVATVDWPQFHVPPPHQLELFRRVLCTFMGISNGCNVVMLQSIKRLHHHSCDFIISNFVCSLFPSFLNRL